MNKERKYVINVPGTPGVLLGSLRNAKDMSGLHLAGAAEVDPGLLWRVEHNVENRALGVSAASRVAEALGADGQQTLVLMLLRKGVPAEVVAKAIRNLIHEAIDAIASPRTAVGLKKLVVVNSLLVSTNKPTNEEPYDSGEKIKSVGKTRIDRRRYAQSAESGRLTRTQEAGRWGAESTPDEEVAKSDREIAETLHLRIRSGVYSDTNMIPRVSSLAREFGCMAGEASRAIRLLRRQGLVGAQTAEGIPVSGNS